MELLSVDNCGVYNNKVQNIDAREAKLQKVVDTLLNYISSQKNMPNEFQGEDERPHRLEYDKVKMQTYLRRVVSILSAALKKGNKDLQ